MAKGRKSGNKPEAVREEPAEQYRRETGMQML